jgi:probable poly-beta-1,6-N-acetyl-D-glucosamine export protein
MDNSRNYAIDFIKAVSILAVIIIHISTAFLDRALSFSFTFNFLLIINMFSRFAVPLFFASSGFLLALKYHSELNTREFYRKRLLRIIPSYTFWFLIYYFLVFPNSFNSVLSWKFINSYLTGNASYQLYFIPAIFALYLLYPLIINYKMFLLSKNFLITFFIFSCILLSLVYYPSIKLPLYSPLRTALYNLFPFLVGIYTSIHREKLSLVLRRYRLFIILSSVLFGLIIFFESLFLFKNFNHVRFLRDQWRPSVMVYALLCGIIFEFIYSRFLTRWNKQIFLISKMSYGVFFIHVAVLALILKYVIDPNHLYGLNGFIFTILNVLLISFMVIYVSSKIPRIGKVISAT